MSFRFFSSLFPLLISCFSSLALSCRRESKGLRKTSQLGKAGLFLLSCSSVYKKDNSARRLRGRCGGVERRTVEDRGAEGRKISGEKGLHRAHWSYADRGCFRIFGILH